jgi:hypothetical protein
MARHTAARKAKPQQRQRHYVISDSSSSSSSDAFSTSISTSSEEERAPKARKPAQHRPEVPLQAMDRRAINARLASEVMFQEGATNAVAALLWRAKQARRPDEEGARVLRALLSGVSGTGKTVLCETVARLMLMGRGEYYERQFVTQRLGGVVEETWLTSIAGCGAGYEGFGGTRTFAHKLRDACALMADGAPPPFVLVLMDELDKAVPALMNALNSLLDRGVIDLASGEEVRPHSETTVVILFAANYAAGEIERADTQRSVENVKRAMRARLMEDCDIGRVGTIIPFHALSREEMRAILARAYARQVPHHSFSLRYGEPVVPEEVHQALTERTLEYYDPALGARGALADYAREVNAWLDDAVDELSEAPRVETALRAVAHYLAVPPGDEHPLLARAAQSSYANRDRIAGCGRRAVPVEMLVLRDGARQLACFVLQPRAPAQIVLADPGGEAAEEESTGSYVVEMEEEVARLSKVTECCVHTLKTLIERCSAEEEPLIARKTVRALIWRNRPLRQFLSPAQREEERPRKRARII